MMLMMMIIARQRNPSKSRSGFKNLKKILNAKKANKINNNIFILNYDKLLFYQNQIMILTNYDNDTIYKI
jgi:hypothetical protein